MRETFECGRRPKADRPGRRSRRSSTTARRRGKPRVCAGIEWWRPVARFRDPNFGTPAASFRGAVLPIVPREFGRTRVKAPVRRRTGSSMVDLLWPDERFVVEPTVAVPRDRGSHSGATAAATANSRRPTYTSPRHLGRSPKPNTKKCSTIEPNSNRRAPRAATSPTLLPRGRKGGRVKRRSPPRGLRRSSPPATLIAGAASSG